MRFGVFASAVILCLATGASARAQEDDSAAPSLWLPGNPWALVLSAPGFTVQRNEIQPDGRRYFLAENPKTRAVVSVYLEAAKALVTTEQCKRSLEARAKQNANLGLKGVAYREAGEMQILEYTIAEVDGVPMNQRNLFACWGKEDAFIDVHLSKVFFKAADQPLFDAILQAVHFVERVPTANSVPAGNSLEFFQEGSRYFLAHQYREAIGPYQKALEIEKVTPILDKSRWRVLVDNLGMSYGIARDLSRAKEVFEYGASKDPEYPMFYYNLACVAAEKGDADDAKSFLKLAYGYRSNMIQGETLPDPRVDDSFQRLLLEKEFRRFVDSLFGPPR